MKKLLVAGAALLVAGSANAGVNISGDARVTYVGKQDYLRNATGSNGYDDYFESRVGVNLEAKNDKGAGAKARVYFDDAGFEDPAIWNGTAKQAVTVDYAYLTAPMGESWKIMAGRINPDYSKFFSWNIRPTRLVAIYEHSGVKLVPFVGVRAEDSPSATDIWDDNDYKEYGLVASFKMPTGWTLKAYGRYDVDERESRIGKPASVSVAGTDSKGVAGTLNLVAPTVVKNDPDRSGFLGDIILTNDGSDCIIGFTAELAYKAADVQGTVDDGMGGYVMLSKKVSEKFTPAVIVGTTKDGYVADNDFGFVMVGGNDFTQVMNVGDGGDLLFGAFVANVAVSSDFSLTGNFLYADFDNDIGLDSAIEVSGVATYALSNGATLTYKLGYLTPSVSGGSDTDEDAYLGHLLRLNLSF